jgi:hypothetical protein
MQKKKMTKAQTTKHKKQAEPFVLLDSDPANFAEDFKNKHVILRPITLNGASPYAKLKKFNPSNTIKYLTLWKKRSIIKGVKKLIVKDNKMTKDKNKKSNKKNAGKSVVWLVFAAQQAFSGYVLLSNFDSYAVIACALVSLGIAGVIVVAHFINAHK